MKTKETKRVIFTTDYNIENYREDFKEWCNENGYNENEKDIDSFIFDDIQNWFDCEKMNLDIECNKILVIANMGLWCGCRSGYKILKGNVREIFEAADYGDDFEFFSDGKDIQCVYHHHDGTNILTFREIKDTATEKGIEKICNMLYNDEEVPNGLLYRHTRSLCPLVNKVYGW